MYLQNVRKYILIPIYFINFISKFQNDRTIVKDLDVKNLSIKTEIDKKPIYGFITGPLDYGETYKVSIFATTTTQEKGIYQID